MQSDVEDSADGTESGTDKKGGKKREPTVDAEGNEKTVCDGAGKKRSFHGQVGKVKKRVGDIISHSKDGKNKSRLEKHLRCSENHRHGRFSFLQVIIC